MSAISELSSSEVVLAGLRAMLSAYSGDPGSKPTAESASVAEAVGKILSDPDELSKIMAEEPPKGGSK